MLLIFFLYKETTYMIDKRFIQFILCKKQTFFLFSNNSQRISVCAGTVFYPRTKFLKRHLSKMKKSQENNKQTL